MSDGRESIRAPATVGVGGAMTLDSDVVEAIARRVAELVGRAPGLVDAHSVAAALQVERDWVYAHARELGAVRLGGGPKARLRFDLERVRDRVAELDPQAVRTPAEEPTRRRPRRSREQPVPTGVKLIQGRSSR
jgi:hypothetical protein